MKCPRCGAEASGRFCSNCGSALEGATCSSCHAALSPGAKFCHACGAPAAAGVPRAAGAGVPSNVMPWAIAGIAVIALVLVAVIVLRPTASAAGGAQAAPAMAQQGGFGTASDISQLTPREAAERLFDRVMAASEHGATDTVAFFKPMALQAYAMIGPLDDEAHFDVGLIHAITGDYAQALAEADSIAAKNPKGLFVSVLRAEVAKRQGDTAALKKAERAFLDHYKGEMAIGRTEYADRQALLSSRQQEFEADLGGSAAKN